MARYNRSFDLDVDDLAVIEDALRRAATERSCADRIDPNLRRIQDVLGKLHNQKTFYRPQSGTYVGG